MLLNKTRKLVDESKRVYVSVCGWVCIMLYGGREGGGERERDIDLLAR